MSVSTVSSSPSLSSSRSSTNPVVDAPFKLSGAESALLISGWVVVWALLARFHPRQQFWHDAWAGTQLVTSRPMSRR